MSLRTWILAPTVTALAVTGAVVAVPTGAAPAPGTPSAYGAPPATLEWGPVKTLARNPRGESLVVDARGNTTVVWASSLRRGTVVALRRPAGGSWGRPVVIGRGYAPEVAADARGNVTVVWLTQRRGFTDGVAAARRPAAGRWSDPVRLSQDRRVPGYPDDGEDVYGAARVDLAVSPRGRAVVAWDWGSEPRDKPWRIQSAQRAPGGSWSEPRNVTRPTGANSPQVGIAADGTAVLLYGRQPFGHPQALLARRRPVGAGWTGPVRVVREGYGPALAVDRAGNALVVFTPNFNRVKAVYGSATGPWRKPRALSPAGVQVSDYALDMSGPGAAVVAVGRNNGRVDLLRRPRSGPWAAPVRVVRPGSVVYDVLVALNRAGDTFLGWGAYGLYGKYRPTGGSWTARSTISRDTDVEVLEATYADIAPQGDVVVLWKQESRPLKVRSMTAP